MKGPYLRLKWELRRLWECPVCKRRERTAGTVTFRHCTCQMQKLEGKPVVMKLLEDEPPHLRPLVPVQTCPVAANAADFAGRDQSHDRPAVEVGRLFDRNSADGPSQADAG